MAFFVFFFFLLLIVYGILIDRYRKWWNAATEYNTAEKAFPGLSDTHSGSTIRASLVIAVRNEQENIAPLFLSLGQQRFPAAAYEIIVVDDHSDDDTWKLLEQIREEWQTDQGSEKKPFLHILKNGQDQHSKKSAIHTGIQSARGRLIITTDADCRFQPYWIQTLVSFQEEKDAEFIAAPVMIERGRSFLSVFQRLDFLTLQGITGGSVDKRFHTMCNGANLAYTKKAFLEAEGFTGIDMIPSGDDMLLMHKIYTLYPDKVFYLKSRQAIVVTAAEKTWRAFFHQRIRWASKAVYYKDKKIFNALALTYAVNVCFLAMAVACLLNGSLAFLLVLFVLAKTIIEYPFVNSVAEFFGQQRLMKYFALLQPLHIGYIIISGWLGRFGSYEWKSRKIKGGKVK